MFSGLHLPGGRNHQTLLNVIPGCLIEVLYDNINVILKFGNILIS